MNYIIIQLGTDFMKKVLSILAFTLFVPAIISPNFSIPGLGSIKELKELPPIKVQPDFSHIDFSTMSDEIGKVSGDIAHKVIQKLIEGGFQGFAEGTEGVYQNTSQGIKNLTQDLTRAIADAFSDPNLKKELARGGKEWAGLVGEGTRGARIGLEQEVFPEVKAITQGAIGSIYNMRNAMQLGFPIALATTIVITGYYGPRLIFSVLEKHLLNPKPAILLPGSKYGRTDRLKRWWAGYKTPPMIFDSSVKERLEEIEEKTKNIREHIRNGEQITYDNLLLYGKPGTGKTLFAQILADKTDMDFLPVTAASLLQVGVEGIKYFDELLTMANKSKYGIIIFVDEADALFVDRDTLSPDSDHYKVLNHILAATGSGSNKFMLIAATNHAYVMDPAMGRRFQDRVLMPLPDEHTRKELITIYAQEQLFNKQTRKPQFIAASQTFLTPSKIDSIAKATAGLSHAEIKDMITIMGKKANATKDGIITARNIDSSVEQAIEKMKALERDRLELEKKKTSRPHIQPEIITKPEQEAAAAA